MDARVDVDKHISEMTNIREVDASSMS